MSFDFTEVAVRDVSRHYGRRRALAGVSLTCRSGEVLGLLGPNGSGKSTILRMLTGYLHPTSGRARIAGFDVMEQGLEARRRIGYVPEDVSLYANMRVDEFLAFMGRLKGVKDVDLDGAVDAACAQLSLDRVRQLGIGKLSRGYRQRVAIAQALLNDPDLLIFDEPTNGLDPRQIIEVRELIRSLAARHTILVTSHILSEIERVATRVAILVEGRLLTVEPLLRGAKTKLLLRIRSDAPQSVQAALAAVQGVASVVARAALSGAATQEFVVEIADAAVAERVAAAVTGAGSGLLEMTAKGTDLEDLFLELTASASA